MSKEDKPKDGLEAAVNEASDDDQTITVLGKEFRLLKELTVPVTNLIYKAQRSEDLSLLIEAVVKMTNKADRAAFETLLQGDDPEVEEELSMEDFNDIFQDALEKVIGRPLEQ